MLPSLGKSQLNLPDLLDFNLKHNPDFPVYVYADPGSDTTTEIRMLEYARAAHRIGKAIRRDSQPGDVIAIVANIDAIVYSALIVGIMKAGLVPFPISPRNSSAALLHLIRKSSTHRIIMTQTTLQGVVDGLKAELEMSDPSYMLSIEEAPALHDAYPFLGKETAEDPFTPISPALSPKDLDKGIYLHSSGSTGFPKPILLTHQIMKDDAALLQISKLREEVSEKPISGAIGLPTFHMMGFCYQVLIPLYGLITTAVFAPTVTRPDAVPILGTAENILEAAKVVKPSSMLAVPTFFHLWSQSDDAVEFLRTLRFLIYAGGPLSPRIAESLISRGVIVVSGYGGTEFGVVTELRMDTETWQYFEFMEGTNIRWVAQGDGTYEAQFLTSETHHVAIENLPDVPGYSTSDLFEPHPTIPNLWKIVGRIDDVIIHSSGEKTVPAPMEAIISANPMVNGAIVFGRQRDQPGILVELLPTYTVDVNDSAQVSKFRNQIWPTIEEANKVAPAFSRIFKEMILIVDPQKPLPRVGKGTVARKAALVLYDSEIDNLYETIESNSGGDSIEPPKSWEVADIQPWLVGQISDILSTEAPAITADLFEYGFDSLSATILRLRLVGAFRKSGIASLASTITQGIVYSYPTIEMLANVLEKVVANPSEGTIATKSHEESIEEMISKYSQGLDTPLPHPVPVDPTQQYVLLTGSTGNLGAQLLETLLLDDSVARVYTLNRPSTKTSMYERHIARFQDKALDVSLLSSPKLVFLSGETSREDLGLPEDTLTELRQNLTMVIHNAWRLDFNLSLASFESHVKGSRVLIDLARSSRHSSSVRFLFTSSISSAQSWDAHTQGPYPEHVVMDAKYAVGGGYGESKYVTERILAKSGLEATSFRIGQVTGGAPNGAWAMSDWVPIIVQSSLSIGVLPDAFGVVSWIPMDAVCSALLDVGFSREPAPITVNVVHPKPVSWTYVIQSIRAALIEEKHLSSDSLPLIPYHDWVDTVERHANNPTEADTQNIPAVKLLDFYRLQSNADDALRKSGETTFESAALTPLKTTNVERLSKKIRTLEPLDDTIVRKWVRYWIDAGL
ncbi:acetyl-CoA synthetase-like protein [Gymnopus androsaceus JB14]|uniref:Acetyl-CoA synthetase-like protein n=1 Tax=Gymnopus androsaceus JB14 TaxID=1447944 RepID=A0A6A4IC89_9AGAR|nr:acetyl-CoA synthetase-like protein [Gymnopus androsaceus JB14]